MNDSRNTAARQRRRAACAVLVAALGATVPALALAPPHSLASAAHSLMQAPASARVIFVEAAVNALVAAHAAAARSAAKGDTARAARWAQGTRAYLATLQRAAVAARAGANVRLVVERGSTVRVIVGRHPSRQFMVSAPLVSGRAQLEQAVLRRFCAIDGCGAPPTSTEAAATASQPRPTVVAVLSADGDGLRCARDQIRHRILYDRACDAVLADARALVEALHAAARGGTPIDWTLPARPRAAGKVQVLAVNDSGGKVELSMPSLAQSPELLVDIMPWARARLAGTPQPLVLTPPSRLVYGLPVAQR